MPKYGECSQLDCTELCTGHISACLASVWMGMRGLNAVLNEILKVHSAAFSHQMEIINDFFYLCLGFVRNSFSFGRWSVELFTSHRLDMLWTAVRSHFKTWEVTSLGIVNSSSSAQTLGEMANPIKNAIIISACYSLLTLTIMFTRTLSSRTLRFSTLQRQLLISIKKLLYFVLVIFVNLPVLDIYTPRISM